MKKNIFDIIIVDTQKIYNESKYRFLKDKNILITYNQILNQKKLQLPLKINFLHTSIF